MIDITLLIGWVTSIIALIVLFLVVLKVVVEVLIEINTAYQDDKVIDKTEWSSILGSINKGIKKIVKTVTGFDMDNPTGFIRDQT